MPGYLGSAVQENPCHKRLQPLQLAFRGREFLGMTNNRRNRVSSVEQIVARMATDNYKFSSLLLGIIDSAPFQMQREGVAK